MSTMALPVTLDGPLPVRPPFGIFSAADIIGPDLDASGVARWLNGATLYGYPPGVPELWDPCSEGTYRVKAEGDEAPTPSFGAVTLYLPITCTAGSVGDPSTFSDRARLVAAAKSQFAVERQLVKGTGNVTNPYLGDGNVTTLGAGAVGDEEGLALLEEALGREGSVGVIHATPGTIIDWGEDHISNDRQMLRTINGTPVISGMGYIDQVPDGQGAVTGDQQWAWGSGPIQIRMTEVEGVPDDISEALTRSGNDANKVTFRAERHFLVSWDTEVQVAVLIDRSA